MKRLFGLEGAAADLAGAVVTVGMFDGVHVGHRAVLERVVAEARNRAAPAVALTFDVHPRTRIDPTGAPPMVTSLAHRLLLFERLGLDATCVLSFDEPLAALDARTFATRYLRDGLRARHLVMGHDNRLGRDGEGDFATIRALGAELGFTVEQAAPVRLRGAEVSSSAIRDAVAAGDLDTAAAMLGRPVGVLGTVVEGLRLGRRLGYPTLNLDPHHELRPPRGVYVTRTRCGDSAFDSVTNIGHRPTIRPDSPEDVLVETHLLDWRGDLYGQTVEVLFLARLRGEQSFPDKDALAAAIQGDVAAARAWFAAR